MQDENTNTRELVTIDSSDALRRLTGAPVIHDQDGCFIESDTWRTNERGAKRAHQDLDLRDSPSRNETLAHRNETTVNRSLSKSSSSADVGVAVVNRSVPPEGLAVEMSEDGNCGVSSAHTEQEWLAGRSIRDRIAALSAAAGVAGIESSPVREKIRNTLIKAVSVVPSSPSDNKTTGNEQTSSTLSNQINESDEKAETKHSVAFDVVLVKAASSRPSPHVVSRFGSNNARRNNEDVAAETTVKPSDAQEKAAMFERPLNGGEPHAKHSREETVLKQSPFRVLKTRGKAKISTETSQPSETKTNAMGKFREMSFAFPRSESRHRVFTFPWSSQPGSKTSKTEPASDGYSAKTSPPLLAFAKRQSEETGGDLTQMPQQFDKKPSELHHDNYDKPDAFGLHTETQSAKDKAIGAETTAIFGGMAKQDKPSRNEHASKTLNDVVQNAAANKGVAFDVGFFEVPSSRLPRRLASRLGGDNQGKKNGESATETVQGPQQTLQKRSTFTIDKFSQSEKDTDGKGPQVSSVLADLVTDGAGDEPCQGYPSLKRNTFTFDTAPHHQDDLTSGVSGYVASPGFTEGSQLLSLLPKGETDEPPSNASQKRNTFTLDTSSCLAGNETSKPHLPEDDEQRTLPLEGATPSSQKRNTFTLDTVSHAVVSVLHDPVTGEVSEQKALQCNIETSDNSQKRNTFTLETVSHSMENASGSELAVVNALRELATLVDNKLNPVESEFETSRRSGENPQKRNTFTLDTISHSDCASEKESIDDDLGESVTQEDCKETLVFETPREVVQKSYTKHVAKTGIGVSDTFLENEGDSLTSGEKHETKEERSTFTLDSVSLSLQSGFDQGLPVVAILDQLARQDICSSYMPDVEKAGKSDESAEKRGTLTLDTVVKSLEDAEQRGIPVVDALDKLATTHSAQQAVSSSEDVLPEKSRQTRGTYTLDTVSQAIEEAVEKGIPVSETLNQIALEGEKTVPATPVQYLLPADMLVQGPVQIENKKSASPGDRDEIEASFENALEQLEECETFDGGESCAVSSRQHQTQSNRGTYTLDDISKSLQDRIKDGVPVVETLQRLSRTRNDSKDGAERIPPTDQKRGTYTLDDVSLSLKTASEQGIPVVQALENMGRTTVGDDNTKPSMGKRGTYTLEDVSQSLEQAKKTGIPVIETLGTLSKEKPKESLRLKIPERGVANRGTYILDKVSHTLERARERGLPVVDALSRVAGSEGAHLRQTSAEAVHRRQGKLTNRKTYALASPLETIGEDRKLHLYDGNQRRMLSPISFHMKSREISSSSVDGGSKARGLGVVQKLDFLTSACELLLETTAKEAADRQRLSLTSEDTRKAPKNAELMQSEGSIQAVESVKSSGGSHPVQPSRNTYSLENVSLTLEDAKAAGIPVVDTLGNLCTASRVKSTPPRGNLMRLNSKSDSEISNGADENSTPDRSTHSLEDVSRTFDNAKKAGLPVIRALDELTNELAEFSKTVNLTEKSEVGVLRPASAHSSCSAPYPPVVRKAYSLDDIALAVKRAFRSGTSLDDILGGVADEPVKPGTSSSSKDIRPRSVDSEFQSALSDFDVSQSFESTRNRSNTYIIDSSNEELDSTRKTDSSENKIPPYMESSPRVSAEGQEENRRTFTLEHVGRSVDNALTRGIPVVDTLQGLSSKTGQNEYSRDKVQKVTEQFSRYTSPVGNDANSCSLAPDNTPSTDVRRSSERKKPVKPKRHSSKKPKTLEPNPESFVIEYFSSSPEKELSKFQIVDNKIQELNNPILNTSGPSFGKNDVKNSNHENIEKLVHISPAEHGDEPVCEQAKPALQVFEEHDKGSGDSNMQLDRDPNSVVLTDTGHPAVTKGRAMWRPSGSVLDKIASLMEVAEDCGISPADVLNDVTHLPSDTGGEIEECEADQLEEEQAVTSQLAYLRMQLDEKRRHIEAEKFRAQEQWEDQRRRLGQTAFWYVIGKAQGGPEFREGTGNRVVHSDRPPLSGSRFETKLHKAEPELPDQPSPPIAWSSPASSPLLASAVKSSAHAQLYETREYRLSEYPPTDAAANVVRPSSEPVADLAPRPTMPARPSSHEPEAVRYTVLSPRKCWDTSGTNLSTPPPFVRPGTAETKKDIALDHPVAPHGGGEAPPEIEVDEPTPSKKGLAMFIGDDTSNQCMTPELEKKRERFLRLRQKKQEEERLRKEAELDKKKKKEEKQREKENLQKMEEERLRVEELERQRAEGEWKARQAAEAQAARVPNTYATYRAGPRKQAYEVDYDASNYFVLGPTQQSGFAEFSGPQCYVKPSGKSNRKIIVNAVSHVCLSGTVNQEQKDKCLQAVSESDGHHFMILFKDGLKFRGLYVHNLDNDQLYKIFGIGPRVVTNKMVEGLYKYNSGGKEFVKIHSKTVSISVDGFAIQKSYWQSGKPSVQSKTSSNLKRPPRQPQR